MEIAILTQLEFQQNTQLVTPWCFYWIESETTRLTQLEFKLNTQLVFQVDCD